MNLFKILNPFSKAQIFALSVELNDWEKDKSVDERIVLKRLLQVCFTFVKCFQCLEMILQYLGYHGIIYLYIHF